MNIYFDAWPPVRPSLQAIFFDLDGTLIDTDNEAVQRLARRLQPLFRARAGGIARRLVMQAETSGNALITLMDWLHLDHWLLNAHTWLRQWRGMQPAGRFHLIHGVEEAVLQLAARYRIGLVTTRARPDLDRFLTQFPRLAQVAAVSYGAQDTRRLKPHPEPILTAARQLGLSPQVCLMVGDTPVDMTSARRAGAWRIGVLSGFGEQAELIRAGAQAVLGSPADLPLVV